MNSDHTLLEDIATLRAERQDLLRQISHLKAARRALSFASELSVPDNAPHGVAVFSAFRILYANQACRDMFDLPPHLSPRDQDVMAFLAPEEWERAAQLIQTLRPTDLRTPLHLDVSGRRHDGTAFPLSLTLISISWDSRPAFLCYLCDISAKKGLEVSRLKSAVRRRLLREMATMFLWDWDPDADRLELDESLMSAFGFPHAESARITFRRLLRASQPEDRVTLRRTVFEGLRLGRVDSAPFRVSAPDGTKRTAVIHGQTLSASQNAIRGMTGILRDVTEQYATRHKLLQARAETECSRMARDRFVSNISHELRTPLNGILGMLQLMAKEHDARDFQRYLSMATLSGKNLLQIINDILEISESGSMEALEETIFSPLELLLSSSAAVRKEAEDKRLTLRCDVDLPPTAMYRGDAKRLGHMVHNILANSVTFTRSGSINLSASIIATWPDQHRLLISVEDTGIGIPDDRLIEVFEPFTQLDNGPARRHQGAGLGLGVVRHTIARMGGTLSVSSEEGGGTTICLTLDLFPCSDASCQRPRSASQGRTRKILLAEDNVINQVLAETILRQLGYEVRPVHNGREVLRALEEEEYGCILMDIQMPEMSGLEATRLIRASNKSYAGVPIIAITAHALLGDREHFLATGMNAYLAKPFSVMELRQAVAQAMGV